MSVPMPLLRRAAYTVALDDDEWQLIRSLREIPPSPLRDAMSGVMEALLAFVADPGCPELQADGAPCTSAHMACDRCHRVLDVLHGMRQHFPAQPRATR